MRERRKQGIIFMVIGCFWIAALSAIIRHLSHELNTFIIVAFNNFFSWIFISIWVIKKERRFPVTKKYGLYFFRALTGVGSMLLWVYAISLIDLADVAAIRFLSPIFTVFLAIIFLHENMNFHRVLALLAGFTGAMIVVRPGTEAFHYGSIIAVLSTIFGAFINMILKKLTDTDRHWGILFYSWLFMMIFSIPLAVFFWQAPGHEQLLWLGLLGILQNLGMYFFSKSYKKTDLVVVMPFKFVTVIFVSIIAYFIFNQEPDIWTMTGAAIILSSAVYAMNRESRLKIEEGQVLK